MANVFEKIGLLRGLTTGHVAKVGPFYVTVDSTRRCNLNCPGCRYHSPDAYIPSIGDESVHHMSLALFQSLCDELHSMGTASMTISGEGEPFMHPQILDMISTAKAKGFTLSVFTNGTLINEDIVNALIDSKLDLLKISLWATSKQEYEKNYPRNSPENFNKVKASLHLITELKAQRKSKLPFLKLHQPIDRRNYRSVGTMLDLAEQTGCDILSFSPFKTQNHMFSSFLLSPEEMQQVIKQLKGLKRTAKKLSIDHTIDTTVLRYKIGGAVWRKLPCYIGWLHVRIKPDGTVIPCNSYAIPMGNLNKERFADIWNGRNIRDFRKQSMSFHGLATIASRFDCYFCCHVADNFRVHRHYRWIRPFLKEAI